MTIRLKNRNALRLFKLAVMIPLFGLGAPPVLSAADFDPLPGAEAILYKTVGDVDLQLHVFRPEGEGSQARPAIVFFFGGGWRNGNPQQFAPHCAYLASRGMVAISAEYRVKSRHGVTPIECIRDAKSAIRYVRAHAEELGIDPNRIAAGGGSAGGHLAAATATLPGFEEEGEDLTISSAPDALALFNPALDVAKIPPRRGFGERAEDASPQAHVRKGLPPTIIFHGTADTTVPHAQAAAFTESMNAAGNRCELVSFKGAGHGFFNAGRGDGTAYLETVRAMDAFLASLDWIQGEPTL